MRPLLFQIGSFSLYSYPLLWGMAWGLAYRLCEHYLLIRNEYNRKFLLYFVGIFITGWIGAKVLFLIVSSHNHLDQTSASFWLGGGFVFLGGLIGATLFTLFSLKKKWISLLQLNLMLPALPFAHAVGRVGCFLAGCCYGKQCDLHAIGLDRYPVQLMESAGLVLIGLWLHRNNKNKNEQKNLREYLISYGILRFSLEFLRGDEIRGVYLNLLSTSQIVSIAMISIGVVMIYRTKRSL